MQEGIFMNNIYEDIAKRTQGDIYIGVVDFDGQRGVGEETEGEVRAVAGLNRIGRILRFFAAAEEGENRSHNEK